MKFEKTDILTTGKIAKYCQVHLSTVHKWISDGALEAYQLPGSQQYRIQATNFLLFLNDHGIPTPGVDLPRSLKTRILIVDDDPYVAQGIIRQLRNEKNFEFATAADGFEAGKKVESFQPNLLMLDLMMPNMDGFKVCKVIRKDPKHTALKILIVSGLPEKDMRKAIECGADDYISKPVEKEELVIKIGALLNLKLATS